MVKGVGHGPRIPPISPMISNYLKTVRQAALPIIMNLANKRDIYQAGQELATHVISEASSALGTLASSAFETLAGRIGEVFSRTAYLVSKIPGKISKAMTPPPIYLFDELSKQYPSKPLYNRHSIEIGEEVNSSLQTQIYPLTQDNGCDLSFAYINFYLKEHNPGLDLSAFEKVTIVEDNKELYFELTPLDIDQEKIRIPMPSEKMQTALDNRALYQLKGHTTEDFLRDLSNSNQDWFAFRDKYYPIKHLYPPSQQNIQDSDIE